MYEARDYSGLAIGTLSKGWPVRAATVLAVGTGLDFGLDHPLAGLFLGILVGVGSVVMGESSMDTGAYKCPTKYIQTSPVPFSLPA